MSDLWGIPSECRWRADRLITGNRKVIDFLRVKLCRNSSDGLRLMFEMNQSKNSRHIDVLKGTRDQTDSFVSAHLKVRIGEET